jgi:hypothetical protein
MDNGILIIVIVILLAMSGWLFIIWKNSRNMSDAVNRSARQQNLVRHDERARMLCRAIQVINPNLSPGIDYIIKHDKPDQEPYIAEWLSSESRPTDEEINSALMEVSNIGHEDKYAAMRKAEYPSVAEQLDAAYEARQGNNARQLEVDERIRRVKEKYPKQDGKCD